MSVIYRGKKLIPAPFVAITPNFIKNEQGEILSTSWNIVLSNSMMAWRGSPTSSGSFWTNTGYPPDETISQDGRMAALFAKQKAMTELFGVQGGLLEIQSWLDGSDALKCNPQIDSLNFPEGLDVEVMPYTINMTATSIAGLNAPSGNFLKNATENWQIELNDQPESSDNPQSFRLTHNVSAQGLLVYNPDGSKLAEPYQLARTFVQGRIGLNNTIIASVGALNLPSYYGGYNQVRSESLDKQTGTYSISETWILSSGTALEDFNVNTHQDIQTGLTTVSIQGSIQGLEVRDSNYQIVTSKFNTALAKFTQVQNSLLTRAQNYSNVSLNIAPVSQDTLKNPVTGLITYNFEYNDRPSNYIPGTRSEIITINDAFSTDLIAIIPILGRSQGPLLQSLSSITETTRTLSIELVFQPSGLSGDVNTLRNLLNINLINHPTFGPYVQNLINAARPVANQVYVQQAQSNYDAKQGRGTVNYTWVYQ